MKIFKCICSELIIVNQSLAQLCHFLIFSFHFTKLISAFINAPCSSNFICSIVDLLLRCQGLEDFRVRQTTSKNQDFARCERKIWFKDNCFRNDKGTWFMPNCSSLSASHFQWLHLLSRNFYPNTCSALWQEVLLSHSNLIEAFNPQGNHKI